MKSIIISQKFSSYAVLLVLGLSFSSLPLLAEDMLDVALHSNVTISLKDGKQISGVRLVNIDNQNIKFEKAGNSGTREINQVKLIAFEGDYEIKTQRGTLVVRGKGLKGCSEQKILVPVTHFKVESKTQAEMNLASLPTTRRKEISQISQVRGFVVNQLQFDGKGAINVLAAACAAQ